MRILFFILFFYLIGSSRSISKSGKIMVLGKWFHIIAGLIWNYLTSEGFKCRIAKYQKLLLHILWKREKNISIILEMSDTFCKILKWKSHHQSVEDTERKYRNSIMRLLQIFFKSLLQAFSYQNHNLLWISCCLS